MDSKHGSGSSKDLRTEFDMEEADALLPLISLMDSEHESRTGIDPGTNVDECTLSQTKKLKSPPSASSTSSCSSLEDLFPMDPKLLWKSSASPSSSPKHHGDVQPMVIDDKMDFSSGASSKSEEPDNSSAGASSSRISEVTHESLPQGMSPTQSPPIQVMERPPSFDLNRIPSSIFGSKPSTPMEWSIASNESLFSIKIGNNSFSRDQLLMLGGDMYKSGELLKQQNKSSELKTFRQPSSIMGGESNKTTLDSGNILGIGKNFGVTRVANEIRKDDSKETVDDKGDGKLPPPEGSCMSPCINRRFDGRESSSQSCAFPIKKKCARPLCQCCSCSWEFCCCKWPSCCSKCGRCYCKWPSCCGKCGRSYCKWPRCCSNWGSCCCKWPSCCSKWGSCSCKWPRWCFKWPSWLSWCCKCPPCPTLNCKWPRYNCLCSWAFCFCGNCKQKGFCCNSSDVLTDGGLSVSEKGSHTQQHLQPPAAEKSPEKSSSQCCSFCSCRLCSCSWLSCFSCRSCSCSRPSCFSCQSCSCSRFSCFSCRSCTCSRLSCFPCRSCSCSRHSCFSCRTCSCSC